MMTYFVLAYLLWVVVCSLVTFVLFGWDKRQAGLGRRRVPEATLWGCSTVGGWPGGLLASRQFRHKTQKQPFRFWIFFGVGLHVVSVLLVAYGISYFNPPGS